MISLFIETNEMLEREAEDKNKQIITEINPNKNIN